MRVPRLPRSPISAEEGGMMSPDADMTYARHTVIVPGRFVCAVIAVSWSLRAALPSLLPWTLRVLASLAGLAARKQFDALSYGRNYEQEILQSPRVDTDTSGEERPLWLIVFWSLSLRGIGFEGYTGGG